MKIKPVNFEELLMNLNIETLAKTLSEASIEDELKHVCQKCPAKYKTQASLKRHMNSVHVDAQSVKTNVCKECEKN